MHNLNVRPEYDLLGYVENTSNLAGACRCRTDRSDRTRFSSLSPTGYYSTAPEPSEMCYEDRETPHTSRWRNNDPGHQPLPCEYTEKNTNACIRHPMHNVERSLWAYSTSDLTLWAVRSGPAFTTLSDRPVHGLCLDVWRSERQKHTHLMWS